MTKRHGMTVTTSLSMSLFVRWPTLIAKWWRHWEWADGDRQTCQRRTTFLVVRLDALGDVVMTTPLFRELKRTFPDSRCTVVLQKAYRSILATNPHVDEILTMPAMPGGWLPLRIKTLLSAIGFWYSRLRGRKFDVVISPRWETDEDLATFLCLLANAGLRVGYTELASAGKSLINRGFEDAFDVCLPAGPVQHAVLRNLAIIEALGSVVEDTSLDIRLSARDRQRAGHILQGAKPSSVLIALGVGARAEGRRWPLERFAQVIGGLARHFPVQPVIVCSPGEREQASQLAGQLPVLPMVVASSQPRDVCAILACCDLFIGNDSGPAHLSAAMGCRTIVISRHPRSGEPNHPNSPVRFAPYCQEVRVLQPDSGLGKCSAACTVRTPHCITGVTPERVIDAALEMLANPLGMSVASQPPQAHKGSVLLAIAPEAAEGVDRLQECL